MNEPPIRIQIDELLVEIGDGETIAETITARLMPMLASSPSADPQSIRAAFSGQLAGALARRLGEESA